MAQHDYSIANGTGSAVRSDLNDALAAIVSLNSGATEPATTFAFQLWADTTANVLKLRNSANNAWITLRQLDGDFTTVSVDNGTAAAPSVFFNASGTDTGFYSSGTDAVDVSTAGTRRFGVGSAGDVTVFGGNVTLNAQGDLRFADSDSSNWVAFQAPATVASNVTWTLPSADGSADQALVTNGSGTLSWADAGGASDAITEGNTSAEVVDTGSDGHFKVITEGTEALRVTAAQLVGIANTNPGAALEVSSGNRVSSGQGGAITVGGDVDSTGVSNNTRKVGFINVPHYANATGKMALMIGDCQSSVNEISIGGSYSNYTAATTIKFWTAANTTTTVGTERMRIQNDGKVFIGTTTTNKATDGFRVESGVPNTSRGSSGSFYEFFDSSTGSRIGYISNSGGTTTVYNTSSDYRLKENVVPLTGAADRINQLQVRRFNFITDPDKTVDGFIAHEAQTVVPECVTGEKDAVDENGDPIYQGIDQSKLVPLLTAALQEALAKIETLEAANASLEARLTALENA